MNRAIEAERTVSLGRPQISWGAVFGGWIFAYGLAMLLYLLGAAVGFTTMDAINNISAGVAAGTAAWMFIAWAVSLYFGGYFSGRLAGSAAKGNGSMHGMVVWALSSVLTVFFGIVQLGGMMTAGSAAVSNVAQAGAAVAGSAGEGGGIQLPQNVTQGLQNQLQQSVSSIAAQGTDAATQAEIEQSLNQMDSQAWSTLAGRLIQGDENGARDVLSQNTNLSEQQINDISGELSSQAGAFMTQAGGAASEAAETTTTVANSALWVLFLCSLIGLGASAMGGAAGAKRAARYYAETYGEPQYHPAEDAEHARRAEQVRHAV